MKLEAYRQCFSSKHHYDLLSWSIAGGVLIFVSLIISAILKIENDCYLIAIIFRAFPAILAIIAVIAWHKIYERNRFWGEVANETARDIEREFNTLGPGIAFMKAHHDSVIQLKNIDENGAKYKDSETWNEECNSTSMHVWIKRFMFCLIVLTVLSVFAPVKSNKSPQEGQFPSSTAS